MKKKSLVIINDFDYIQGGASKIAINTASIMSKYYDTYLFSGVSDNRKHNYPFQSICLNQKENLKNHNVLKGVLFGLYNVTAYKELKKLLSTLNKKETIIHVHGWTKSLSSSIFKAINEMGFKYVLTAHDYFTVCPNGAFYNFNTNKKCPYKGLSQECKKSNCDSRNKLFKKYRLYRQKIFNKYTEELNRIKDLIVVSDYSWKILKPYLSENTNIYKIYNVVDIEKKDYNEQKIKNQVVFVGRVCQEKGTQIFCEAVNDLNVKALVVGSGPQLEYLKNKYTNIEFVGWKTEQEITDILRKSSVLVFPSLCHETAGLTVLEALANGVVPIVSDDCAGKEFINEKTGMIFKNGNAEDLKEKVISLINSDDLKLMSKTAYLKYWESPYNQDYYARKLLACYQRVVENNEKS